MLFHQEQSWGVFTTSGNFKKYGEQKSSIALNMIFEKEQKYRWKNY